MVNVILWIDDEPDTMDPFRETLSNAMPGVKIEFFDNVDSGLAFVQALDQYTQVKAIIWDMMLPPGQAFADLDTQAGTRTGILLHARLRETFPHIPFVLFTNTTEPSVLARYRNPPTERALRKDRVGVGEFAQFIVEALATV